MFPTAVFILRTRRFSVLPLACALAATSTHRMDAQTMPSPAPLDAATIAEAVAEIATIVAREYVDPAIADRVAGTLRQSLRDGAYADLTSADVFPTRVNRDLSRESHDKHLMVTIVRRASAGGAAASPPLSRQEGARRNNGGVQRVEILAGNVGYLNLTAFWRLEEAQDAITAAMRLRRRADALIIDLRQNGGGSPESVALLVGYLFVDEALPLFDIVSRDGTRDHYATPRPGVVERDERRPVFVLTSTRTFSAGEGLAFLLQERGRAEVVGEQTPGAANPGQPYFIKPTFEVTVPNGRVESAFTGKNWEGTGIMPNTLAAASDALTVAHAHALERLGRTGVKP